MKVFKCLKCGTMVEVLKNNCDSLTCCGEKMVEVKAGSVDAALEKHVPFCEIQGDNLYVRVGEVEHPMTEEHYIEWIVAEYSDSLVKYYYKPGDKPEADFALLPGEKVVAVLEYCNLHGLYKA